MMLNIELDPVRQKQLDEMACSLGQNGAGLALHILQDYLDLQNLPNDSEEAWAEASEAMASEVMENESWEAPADGPK